MNCLECKRLDLQANKKHSAVGLGRCPDDPLGTFVNIRMARTCAKFQPAPDKIVAARKEWSKGI